MIYRRLLAFFLSFALIFSSTSALATTSVGGWTATDSLIAGANTTINAAKTAGGKALKSSITVAASASKVGKYLIKGGGKAALAYAVVELLGEGIDWVLDPANNRVKYTVPGDIGDDGSYYFEYAGKRYSTHDAACNAALKASAPSQYDQGYRSATWVDTHRDLCRFLTPSGSYTTLSSITANRKGGGGVAAPPVEKYIPIDVVAAKVISNAEAGHGPSQEAVKATALEGFAAGEHDAALDAAAVPDTGVENPPETENPPKDPAEPFDPSGIISAINALKALLAGILSSITSLADWFKGEPEGNKPEDNKIDIPDVPLPNVDSSISFGGSCPADLGADFNLYGTNFNFVLMPFSKLCPLLSTFVKPTLILLGSFMAVAIVGGRKDA